MFRALVADEGSHILDEAAVAPRSTSVRQYDRRVERSSSALQQFSTAMKTDVISDERDGQHRAVRPTTDHVPAVVQGGDLEPPNPSAVESRTNFDFAGMRTFPPETDNAHSISLHVSAPHRASGGLQGCDNSVQN